MRHTPLIVLIVCLAALGAATATACSGSGTSNGGSNGGSGGGSGGMMDGSGGGGSGGMMGGSSSPGASSSLGERIFLSGVGTDGQTIPHSASRVSQGSLMMGGGGCASCHGADGRGGAIRMMAGTAVDVPDITYDALIAEGFADATIGEAIRDGVDEAGKPLDEAMPRWRMSDPDLAATISYLKNLSAH